MSPRVPVSWGELLDKITILEIKSERIASPDARRRVASELAELLRAAEESGSDATVVALKAALRAVNERLWEIEDRIREKESRQEFDAGFIELARSVYRTNDERAALKREVNLHLRSALTEEKQYAPYPESTAQTETGCSDMPALPNTRR